VAAALREDVPLDQSFDAFMNGIRRAVELSSGELVTLGTSDKFLAKILDNQSLTLETNFATCLLEEDDLRGVWLGLQSGLVTERQAGWSIREGGKSLISLLSLLPRVRAVEIQRSGCPTPEFALEPRPTMHDVTVAQQSVMQHELAWH
jgi:hypothetical protein